MMEFMLAKYRAPVAAPEKVTLADEIRTLPWSMHEMKAVMAGVPVIVQVPVVVQRTKALR
jgi:hypothetical protein